MDERAAHAHVLHVRNLAEQRIGFLARAPAPEGQGTERGPRMMEHGIEIFQTVKMKKAELLFRGSKKRRR